MGDMVSDGGIEALQQGDAFVDLSGWRKVLVGGSEAVAWLHDLLTADVAGLGPGRARRSLLLTPTGRIRADLTVVRREDDVLLLQAPDQSPVDLMLGPYVLSSDIRLEDVSGSMSLLARLAGALREPGAFMPSPWGGGSGLVATRGPDTDRVRSKLAAAGLAEASEGTLDIWRIRKGIARMLVDFGTDALPADVGLEWTVDASKGCFLGQESFVRVRNMGHPVSALVHVRAGQRLRANERVLVDGLPVGSLTSVAQDADGAWIALARIGWRSIDEALSTDAGVSLLPLPSTT
jgi:folate-binding protein YgfZ